MFNRCLNGPCTGLRTMPLMSIKPSCSGGARAQPLRHRSRVQLSLLEVYRKFGAAAVPSGDALPSAGSMRQNRSAAANSSLVAAAAHEVPLAGTTFPWDKSQGSSNASRLPNQAETVFNPTRNAEDLISGVAVAEKPSKLDGSDLDYLSELLAIQTSDGPKALGFFGTRNMGMTHQKLVEVLAYAYVFTGNHIFTSGATGTNAAVIKGALRANCQERLTVILPQSLKKQPFESQELLGQVGDLVEMPQNDELSLLEASRICNREIISRVQQVISFAFHDSRLILEAAAEAKAQRKIVTLFYLD